MRVCTGGSSREYVTARSRRTSTGTRRSGPRSRGRRRARPHRGRTRRDVHEQMRLVRRFDERVSASSGRSDGDLSAAVRSGSRTGRQRPRAGRRRLVFPSYREHGVGLVRGLSSSERCSTGWATNRATTCPKMSTSSRSPSPSRPRSPTRPARRGRRNCRARRGLRLLRPGDGATSEGDFHEGAELRRRLRHAERVLL